MKTIRLLMMLFCIPCAFGFSGTSADAQSTWRVSVNSFGQQGDWGGSGRSISADGRWVAWRQSSDTLKRRDDRWDVWVRRVEGGESHNLTKDMPGSSDAPRWRPSP